MRWVTMALAAVLGLYGSPVAGEALDARFRELTRSASWRQASAVPVGFATHHPQGFAAAGDALFMSSVEIIEPTRRFEQPQDGYDRTPGEGRGHVFRMSRDGRLLGQAVLGEGDVYHPGGIDHDGLWLWVPVAEYRPNSASILYRVDPATLAPVEIARVRDHIGGLLHDPSTGRLHGVSWGSRRFYTWKLEGDRVTGEPVVTANPSHYVDYQDCALVSPARALCSGVAEHRPNPSARKWALGGLDLVDLDAGRPLHQVPMLLWTDGGEAMTRNPVLVEATGEGLRALFMPDDDRSTLYTYEAATE